MIIFHKIFFVKSHEEVDNGEIEVFSGGDS